MALLLLASFGADDLVNCSMRNIIYCCDSMIPLPSNTFVKCGKNSEPKHNGGSKLVDKDRQSNALVQEVYLEILFGVMLMLQTNYRYFAEAPTCHRLGFPFQRIFRDCFGR
ncbi:hypothetical protein CHS0354_042190 [Potamilus streckersoni]|uniref:Uncharacterized protein n=1 Tax=Potamilus streckersoni TaxID=2493646 RepID=A0AAE0WHN6_9BIVA|nr:hypothetical protein CHS0354_042190 [Potamilus streckersoni]